MMWEIASQNSHNRNKMVQNSIHENDIISVWLECAAPDVNLLLNQMQWINIQI